MNIFVCGVKHSGKSTLGKLLAKNYNFSHYDLDDLIEDYYFRKFNLNKSVRNIYKDHGAGYFHSLEHDTLESFLNHNYKNLNECLSCKTNLQKTDDICSNSNRCTVLSLGGGTIENREIFKKLKLYGLLIYLRADADILIQRILRKGLPPFLKKESYAEDFRILYTKRDKAYCELSDIIIELKDTPIKKSLSLILNKIEEYVYARKHIR